MAKTAGEYAMPKVKICGNTSPEDVQLAASLGADYLGIIFAESKRQVGIAKAKTILKTLPKFGNFVAVFCNQPKQLVEKTAGELGIRILQFHGDETARYCDHFMNQGHEVIKTFRIKDAMSLKRLDEYNVHSFLFDTFSRTEAGGTGTPFDWDIIEDRPYVHEKLFLAGGLNVQNLQSAIAKIRPFAVDVASGVEKKPGVKDPELLKTFIQIAKEGKVPHAIPTALRP